MFQPASSPYPGFRTLCTPRDRVGWADGISGPVHRMNCHFPLNQHTIAAHKNESANTLPRFNSLTV
jgi:hypothetical protein